MPCKENFLHADMPVSICCHAGIRLLSFGKAVSASALRAHFQLLGQKARPALRLGVVKLGAGLAVWLLAGLMVIFAGLMEAAAMACCQHVKLIGSLGSAEAK